MPVFFAPFSEEHAGDENLQPNADEDDTAQHRGLAGELGAELFADAQARHAQGIGTSMLQIPNIMKRPLIWLPPTLASAILGPIAIIGPFHMTNNATGSGMGTSGLVGQIMTYQTMVETESPVLVILKIVLFHFLLPGLLSYVIYRGMRNMGYIKDGQMKLNV